MIGEVVSLLAVHLAAGSLIVTAALAFRHPLPEGFLRFCALGAAAVAALAILLSAMPASLLRSLPVIGGILWYVSLRRGGASGRGAPFLAGLAGFATLALECASAPAAREAGPFLCSAGALSSGLLLGAVTVSMVLGHWYLVAPSLSIAPLRQGALWLWGSIAARLAFVLAALFLGGWELLRIQAMADLVFSTTALFFSIRALTGIGAPLLLAALIWQTVKIRSTQSATGLLYVALFLVLFGELVSQFLSVTTGYPL